ncbi:MAG: hypothetical protein HOO94_02260 [Novosphingobium sp.]|uniref:DcaP family trimeric outer membrane transporter n=1 Tax=Novosphingobium sp. TaxID=1874826 RepID=UPI0017AA30D6|nr:hypothetical protein [Novosphingobium sp.]
MKQGKRAWIGILLGASALAMPQLAAAQTARETELEQRLARLEAEMQQLRADLVSARDSQAQANASAQAAVAKSNETATKVAALETRPQAEGMRSGSTTIKLGGYIKLLASSAHYDEGEVATNSLGRDFYLPQTIPTGTGPASHVSDFTAKQSRFWLNLSTDVAGHVVKGYVETDFQTSPGTQGSQRTTNGYNLALRRAYMQVDRFTFGQDWTTFQYTGALPESTDYVGGSEGTVFVRQPLVRYSAPLSKQTTLHLSVENAESGTATVGAPALVENGDDRMPDFAARLVHTGKRMELSLGGLVRQVRVENAGVAASSGGYGVSLGGKLFLNDAKSGDVRFMATYGHNISRYVGLNFAPDGVYDPVSGKLRGVNVFAAIGAVRLPLSPQVRVNLMGSYQSVNYDDLLTAANVAIFNKQAWSGAINLFYSPVKAIDLGIEYRHGTRELVNGASGATDRVEFAAKYSF